MKVVIAETKEAAARYAADRIISFVKEANNPVLGLATGRTPLLVYENLAEAYASGSVSFKKVRSFNLDEYVGLDRRSSYSFASYMKRNFIDKTDVCPSNVRLPDGCADLVEEAKRYDAEIMRAGGIGLQLLSIGTNGHIGFNEPGSAFDLRTHVAKLAPETLEANRDDLPDAPPSHALTLGIATILEADAIVMLATGRAKAQAVRDCLEGPMDIGCPASALQLHANALVILDREAASLLRPGWV